LKSMAELGEIAWLNPFGSSENLLSMKHFPRWALLASLIAFGSAMGAEPAIQTRGYYMTFMRMPTFGLPEWKQMVDCIQEDGGNTLLLWTAGGFRSNKFPITWEYNRAHKNVQKDFVRELIDYAHTKQIQVLLCLTPFAYDGVNQYPLAHPDLKARQNDGEPAKFWGMHSWGYNLCPSKTEAQQFMLDYAREMFFDFYPNADGLMIESSDYAICYCAECGEKYFEKEFQFVRAISDAVWAVKPRATIAVYPHYFSTRKVPGFDVAGSTQVFDPRWSLFFTAHSAHLETNLIARARTSIYSDEGLSMGTPERIHKAARLAQQYRVTGYIPSLEPMTCPASPPNDPGPLLKPFQFAWLKEGEMPLNELLIRVNRIAYREFAKEPGLSTAAFEQTLAQELFGNADQQAVRDVLRLQATWLEGVEWLAPGPYVAPERLKRRAEAEKWEPEKLEPYRNRVRELKEMVKRYAQATNKGERELARIAQVIVARWEKAGMLTAE